MYYQNAGGFKTKLREFQQAVTCSVYDILIFCETWLTNDVPDAELGLTNFNIFRVDREATNSTKKRGGGVLIAIKKHLKAKKLEVPQTDIEQVFVLIKIGNESLILGCVYIPPASSIEVYQSHCDSLEFLMEHYPDLKVAILGDFNLPEAVWSRDEIGITVQCPDNSSAIVLASVCAFLNLCQLNSVLNSRNVMLDLILSNLCMTVKQAEDIIFSNSIHHTAICFELCMSTSFKSVQYEELFYDFKGADYIGVNDCLAGMDWNAILVDKNINEAVSSFYNVLYNVINYYVPCKRYKTSNFPRWFDANLRKLIIDKKIAHSNFKKYNSEESYTIFSHLREQCKEQRRVCYQRYLNKVETNLNCDPRYFWSYVREQKNHYDIPVSMSYNNRASSNISETVDLFASFFASVYVDAAHEDIKSYGFDSLVSVVKYNTEIVEVYEAIADLPSRTTSGPDGIPAWFLKQCVSTLAIPLNMLFNISLNSGNFPEAWRSSYLKPIFKSGERNLVTNYRAVCIQSDMPKILDQLISRRLAWDFRGIINPHQHGFVRGRSTNTNLCLYQHFIVNSLEGHAQVDSVYTDFSKAFDRVNHNILLSKLSALGVGGTVLEWMRSYVSGRTQCVRCGGYTSGPIFIPSGVPQGSHCGPILFNIFLLDLVHSVVNSNLLMFADDVKLFRSVVSEGDSIILQNDINKFYQWCHNNKMDLNIEKCNVITFSRSSSPILNDYTLNGVILARRNNIKDLGVTIDSKLTFTTNISNMSIKAMKVLGFIKRLSVGFSIFTFKRLFCALVRPILEYCSVIWSPNYRVHIETIERIQRRFLRTAAFRLGLSREDYVYDDILSLLNMKTLESRRSVADICFLHGLISGRIDCPEILCQINFNVVIRRNRHTNVFRVPFHSTNYGSNESLTRIIRQTNEVILDHDICIFSSKLVTLKNVLNAVI